MELDRKIEEFGKKIENYRNRVGYKTRYQLAVVMDCGAIQISNYENGKSIPSKLVVRELIEALNLTRDEAIEFINEANELRLERRKVSHNAR